MQLLTTLMRIRDLIMEMMMMMVMTMTEKDDTGVRDMLLVSGDYH